MSMTFDASPSSPLSSSSPTRTYWSFANSYPRTSAARSTTSLQTGQKFCSLMREPHLAWSRLKETLCDAAAVRLAARQPRRRRRRRAPLVRRARGRIARADRRPPPGDPRGRGGPRRTAPPPARRVDAPRRALRDLPAPRRTRVPRGGIRRGRRDRPRRADRRAAPARPVPRPARRSPHASGGTQPPRRPAPGPASRADPAGGRRSGIGARGTRVVGPAPGRALLAGGGAAPAALAGARRLRRARPGRRARCALARRAPRGCGVSDERILAPVREGGRGHGDEPRLPPGHPPGLAAALAAVGARPRRRVWPDPHTRGRATGAARRARARGGRAGG